jgi:hypothetical protein
MISFNTVVAEPSRLAAASEAKAMPESVMAHSTTRSSIFINSSKMILAAGSGFGKTAEKKIKGWIR